MKIKRYTGVNAQEAMLKVKADLGSEALIMSTGKVRQKGAFGFFKKPLVEVVAAIDDQARKRSVKTSPVSKSSAFSGARKTPGAVGLDGFRVAGVKTGAEAGAAASSAAGTGDKAGAGVGAKAGVGVGVEAGTRAGARGRYISGADVGAGAAQPRPGAISADDAFEQFQQHLRRLSANDAVARQTVGKSASGLSEAPNRLYEPDKTEAQKKAELIEQVELIEQAERIQKAEMAERAEIAERVGREERVRREERAGLEERVGREERAAMIGRIRRDERTGRSVASESHERLTQIESKISHIEKMLSDVCRDMNAASMLVRDESAEQGLAPLSAVLKVLYDRLLKNDVEPEFALSIVERVSERMMGKEDGADVEDAFLGEIRRALGNARTLALRKDKKPTVAIFVGPTGVGKTTTLAKIAANYTLSENAKVAMVTADTYRIAAVQQLRTYAEILGLPLEVVYSSKDMARAIDGFSDADLVLVDTAGRSFKNSQQFEELKELVAECEADEVFLALSSTSSAKSNREIIHNYGFLGRYKIIITKADEIPALGAALNARMLSGMDLSYVTVGQSVPDDIEVADVDAIASGLAKDMSGALTEAAVGGGAVSSLSGGGSVSSLGGAESSLGGGADGGGENAGEGYAEGGVKERSVGGVVEDYIESGAENGESYVEGGEGDVGCAGGFENGEVDSKNGDEFNEVTADSGEDWDRSDEAITAAAALAESVS